MPAKKDSFATRLLRSASQAVAVSKGEMKPSRTFTVPMTTRTAPHIPDAPEFTSKEIASIRERIGASQPVFAKYLGVSVSTIRTWEQGDKVPTGSARRLLQFAHSEPSNFVAFIERSVNPSGGVSRGARKTAGKVVAKQKARRQLSARA